MCPRARVLEIGCAAGGNLIPFAAAHPHAHVVGIDLSQVQIDHGRARVQALGLDNMELLAGDIARMDLAALGQFDFVIAHGVYSWVPAEVQDALLSAFRGLLAPDGIAYMSYNIYPGWKSKEVVRDAMLLASGSSATPEEKVREARGMADFLEEVAPADGVLARMLAVSRSHAIGFGDNYLLHDELETFNAPCYFYEMLGRAERARAGLSGGGAARDDDPGQLRPEGRGVSAPRSAAACRCWWSSTSTSCSTGCSANRCWFTPSGRRRSATSPDRSRFTGCTSPRGCRRSTARPAWTTRVRSIGSPTAPRCSPTTRASRRHWMRSAIGGRGLCRGRSLVDAVHAGWRRRG